MQHQKKMKFKALFSVLSVTLLFAFLTGCGEVRSMLGQNKQSPDEFAVLSQAPLSIPPNFTLRAPEPGAKRPKKTSKRSNIKRIVVKSEAANAMNPSPIIGGASGEKSLRNLLGTSSAKPDIRRLLNEENKELIYTDQRLINKLLKWPSGSATRSLLDAAAESERIKTNLDTGKPINEGETPVIKESGKNFIKKLFR